MTAWTQHPGDTYDEAEQHLTALLDFAQMASFGPCEIGNDRLSSLTVLMQRQMQTMRDAQAQMAVLSKATEQTPPKKKAAVGAAASV